MSLRTRVALYGASLTLILVGILAVILVPGATGDVLAIGGGSLGGIGLISLAFMEVGLSEDRERERATAAAAPPDAARPPRRLRPPRRRRG